MCLGNVKSTSFYIYLSIGIGTILILASNLCMIEETMLAISCIIINIYIRHHIWINVSNVNIVLC